MPNLLERILSEAFRDLMDREIWDEAELEREAQDAYRRAFLKIVIEDALADRVAELVAAGTTQELEEWLKQYDQDTP